MVYLIINFASMKLFHLFCIVVLGIFLLPSISYACGNVASAKTVKTENISKEPQNSCCKITTKTKKAKSCCDEQQSDSKNKPCEGKCGHSKCSTTSSSSSMTFSSIYQFESKLIDLYSKETNFTFINYNLSSGYVSLWLIPKIS
jgi:hypothetical protein